MAELRKAIRELRKSECPPISKMSKEDMVAHLQRLAASKKQGKKLPIQPMAPKEKAAAKKAVKKAVEKAVTEAVDKITHEMTDDMDLNIVSRPLATPAVPLTPEEKARREKELDDLVKTYSIAENIKVTSKPVITRAFVPARAKPSGAAAILAEVEAEVAAKRGKAKKEKAPKAEKAKRAAPAGAASRMAMVQKIRKERGVSLKEAHSLYAEGVRV